MQGPIVNTLVDSTTSQCNIGLQKTFALLKSSLTLSLASLMCHIGVSMSTMLQLCSASKVLAAVQAGQVASLPGHNQYDGGREHKE